MYQPLLLLKASFVPITLAGFILVFPDASWLREFMNNCIIEYVQAINKCPDKSEVNKIVHARFEAKQPQQ